MKLPMTLLRSHARRRSNPRVSTSTVQAGGVYETCDIGSRWHRFAFTAMDRGRKLTVSQEKTGYFALRVNNKLRTEVASWQGTNAGTFTAGAFKSITYEICSVAERLYTTGKGKYGLSKAQIRLSSDKPKKDTVNGALEYTSACWRGHAGITVDAMPIFFSAINSKTTYDFRTGATFATIPFIRDVLILSKLSKKCGAKGMPVSGFAFMQYAKSIYKYDQRLKLLENTVEKPADVVIQRNHGAGWRLYDPKASKSCPTAARTFLNAGSCKRISTCAPLTFTAATLTLDKATMRSWYTTNGRYVYYMTGLRLTDAYKKTPCDGSSRWEKVSSSACAKPTALSAAAKAGFKAAIAGTSDKANPLVRDIPTNPKGIKFGKSTVFTYCHMKPTMAAADSALRAKDQADSIGATVDADGACWKHVHPQQYDVYDMTYWAETHQGNFDILRAGKQNPIMLPAQLGTVKFVFPASHPMLRFAQNWKKFPKLGRFGDKVQFEALPTIAQTKAMAELVGALSKKPGQGSEACGSPGEVANDPTLSNAYYFPLEEYLDPRIFTSLDYLVDGRQSAKSMTFYNVAIKGADQLRHRVAWSLLQILVISATNSGGMTGDEGTPWMNFYDIHARNAFGSFRDDIKEVTYNPMMGNYLTYKNNKAFRVTNNPGRELRPRNHAAVLDRTVAAERRRHAQARCQGQVDPDLR